MAPFINLTQLGNKMNTILGFSAGRNLHLCFFLIVTCCCSVSSAAKAQVTTEAEKIPIDLTSPQLDWNPKTEFSWPEKKWNLDPWWDTAIRLVEAKVETSTARVPGNTAFYDVAESWNRRLLKALKFSVVQLGQPEAHEARQEQDRFELIKTSFTGPVEFEIRQSIWVWTLWFPKSSCDKLRAGGGVMSLLPREYLANFVLVDNEKAPPGTKRLDLQGLPPYLQDIFVFETQDGLCISGSKIMGRIAQYPGHSVLHNKVWFGGPKHVRKNAK
jgi:hypothetical protein